MDSEIHGDILLHKGMINEDRIDKVRAQHFVTD